MATFRPCREIYRPRPARSKNTDSADKKWLETRLTQVLESADRETGVGSSHDSCSAQHNLCRLGDSTADRNGQPSTPPANSTSSKSIQHILSILNEFKTPEEKSLLLDAMDASKYLSTIQMMRVVRLIFMKALESSSNAYSMTWLSFLIMEQDASELFLESLLTCCREWLSQQETELKRKNRSHEAWPAFIAFLRELYASIQPKKTKVRPDREPSDLPIIQSQKHSQCLANLVLDSGLTLMDAGRCKDANYVQHVESVVHTLRCVGIYLEQENKFKLEQLIMIFRKVLLSEVVKVSSICKKNLMEAIECKASNWFFSPNQQVSRTS